MDNCYSDRNHFPVHSYSCFLKNVKMAKINQTLEFDSWLKQYIKTLKENCKRSTMHLLILDLFKSEVPFDLDTKATCIPSKISPRNLQELLKTVFTPRKI